VAEHGGLQASPDRRLTTHHVRQSFTARFWMVPFNTGWHLAHHVDIGVPFSKLPRLQEELERAGYATPELEWPSYRALWRHASSRTAAD
jgi:fatty acid desaturase